MTIPTPVAVRPKAFTPQSPSASAPFSPPNRTLAEIADRAIADYKEATSPLPTIENNDTTDNTDNAEEPHTPKHRTTTISNDISPHTPSPHSTIANNPITPSSDIIATPSSVMQTPVDKVCNLCHV